MSAWPFLFDGRSCYVADRGEVGGVIVEIEDDYSSVGELGLLGNVFVLLVRHDHR